MTADKKSSMPDINPKRTADIAWEVMNGQMKLVDFDMLILLIRSRVPHSDTIIKHHTVKTEMDKMRATARMIQEYMPSHATDEQIGTVIYAKLGKTDPFDIEGALSMGKAMLMKEAIGMCIIAIQIHHWLGARKALRAIASAGPVVEA